MPNELDSFIALLTYLIGALLVLFRNNTESILEIWNNTLKLKIEKQDKDENEDKDDPHTNNTNQLPETGQLVELANEAQYFLHEVGKNYFDKLIDDADEFKSELRECEDHLENLRQENQAALLEREELRVIQQNSEKTIGELRMNYAELTQRHEQLNEKMKTLENESRRYKEIIRKMQNKIGELRNIIETYEKKEG